MTDHQIEALKKKLVDVVNHHAALKSEKKAFLGALGEQIKEAAKRIDAIGDAIKKRDITLLSDVFEDGELDYLFRREEAKDV